MRILKLLLVLALWVILGLSQAGACPILWINDSSGNIGTVDVASGKSTFIGNSGVMLTDIAFDPCGNLFGISFTDLYRINKKTGKAKKIGPLGLSGANALVFGPDGTLYTAERPDNTTNLYTVNTATGATTSLGNDGFFSSGDLAFKNGTLFLADTKSTDFINNNLVKIDLSNLANSAEVGPFGFSRVFGLATAKNNVMYGVAGTQIFSVNTTTGEGTFVSDYGGGKLLDAFGSAFITESVVFRRRWRERRHSDLLVNFYLGGRTYDFAGGLGQLIPDPAHTPLPVSALLLGSGLLGLGLLGWRRKRGG